MNKEITLEISKEQASNLQALDCDLRSKKEVLATLMDMHAMDNNTKFISSPMVAACQKQIADAQQAFQKAQDDIVNELISKEDQPKVVTWSVNYSAAQLVYVVEE
jgi:hypothetical protein